MPRPFTPKVITANALIEGDVVYLTEDDRWSRAAVKDGTPEPTHFREEFRRTGPSNYFHGKQAEG